MCECRGDMDDEHGSSSVMTAGAEEWLSKSDQLVRGYWETTRWQPAKTHAWFHEELITTRLDIFKEELIINKFMQSENKINYEQ